MDTNKVIQKPQKPGNMTINYYTVQPEMAERLLLEGGGPEWVARPGNGAIIKKIVTRLKRSEWSQGEFLVSIDDNKRILKGHEYLCAVYETQIRDCLMKIEHGATMSPFVSRDFTHSIASNAEAMYPGSDINWEKDVPVATLLSKIAGKYVLETDIINAIREHAVAFKHMHEYFTGRAGVSNTATFYTAAFIYTLLSEPGPMMTSLKRWSEYIGKGHIEGEAVGPAEAQLQSTRDKIIGKKEEFAHIKSRATEDRIEIVCLLVHSMKQYYNQSRPNKPQTSMTGIRKNVKKKAIAFYANMPNTPDISVQELRTSILDALKLPAA